MITSSQTSHSLRVANPSTNGRPKSDPTSIIDQLRAAFTPQGSEVKKSVFYEILSRCITDVAGNLHHSDDAHPDTLTLGKMYKGIARKYNPDLAFNILLHNIPAYTFGMVQTPHPTEMLSKEAIAAEEELMRALTENGRAMFTEGTKLSALGAFNEGVIRSALSSLYKELTPVEEKLTIEAEMKRSVILSNRIFAAIPMITDSFLEATDRQSGQLSKEELECFSRLIHPETWSPGDSDSKPDMNSNTLQEGLTLNRYAMYEHYFREMAALGDAAQIDADSKAPFSESVKADSFHIMHKLLNTAAIHRAKSENYKNGKKNGKNYEAILRSIPYYQELCNSGFIDDFKGYMEQHKDSKERYNSAEEFRNELLKLREQYPGSIITTATSPKHARVARLDALIIQIGNFDGTALRSQIRQNATVHSEVCNYLQKLDIFKDYDLQTEEGINVLLEKMKDESFRFQLRKVVRDEIKRIKGLEEQSPSAGTEEGKFYHCMNTFKIAAKSPDFVPHYLIAECSEAEHMLQAFLLLKIMEPKKENRRHVEIVPLVEYPEQVMEKDGRIPYVEMMKTVLSNPHYRTHQNLVTAERYHARLLDAKIDGNDINNKRKLTVGDVKAQQGRSHTEKDDKKVIESTQIIMGAGSDVSKSGGQAAVAAMDHAIERVAEEMLELDSPVLIIPYKGSGGGMHRSQPASTTYQTFQGRSMRQMPENIARKEMTLLTYFLRNRLASEPEPYLKLRANSPVRIDMGFRERKVIAQLNVGNMAGLPLNPDIWNQHTKKWCYAAIERYQEMYKSEAFKELVAHSANIFSILTANAARPDARVDAKKGGAEKGESDFPPADNVLTKRAIGFGAALNGGGSCALLFYGLGELQHVDDNELRLAYLYDPKAQDVINRATYGIIMADLETAWKYLKMDKVPEKEELERLTRAKPEGQDRRLALARKALAQITLEHDIVAKKLIKLHRSLVPSYNADPDRPAFEKLLDCLPLPLQEQMAASRKTIHPAREALAELFNNEEFQKQLPAAMEKRAENPQDFKFGKELPQYGEIIYPAMAAVMECFEHAPRAYTMPHWALAQTMPQAEPTQAAAR